MRALSRTAQTRRHVARRKHGHPGAQLLVPLDAARTAGVEFAMLLAVGDNALDYIGVSHLASISRKRSRATAIASSRLLPEPHRN